MLAYVYGVVPISLCRSGGCGVSAGNGKGVRIEFDDENDMNVGSGAVATGEEMVSVSLPSFLPSLLPVVPSFFLLLAPNHSSSRVCL